MGMMAYPLIAVLILAKGTATTALSAPRSDNTAALRLSVNGLPLSDFPFLDHTHEWPPKLTWMLLGADEVNLQQVAYTVHVDGAHAGGRTGSAMAHILRAPARSNQAHTISLSVTLAGGRVVRGTGQFRTALLWDGFGNASWISGGTLLRRRLAADLAVDTGATVVNATAYASGVGCFAIRLDGALVSSSFMDPGWATLPTKRVTYRAFDLTSHFAPASPPPQQLQVALGMCKYGYQGSFCVGAHAANGACKAFLLSLRLTYSDGTTRTIDSSAADGKWEATTSANPIRYAHLYHGEQYDGRVTDTPAQWRAATASMFDTGEGGGAVAANKALGQPVLLTMPPLEVSQKYTPISVKRVGTAPTTLSQQQQQLPVAAAAAGPPPPPPLFVRCSDDVKTSPLCGVNIWFEDVATQTRHHVPSCQMCGLNPSPCAAVRNLPSANLSALHAGPEFNCSMVPPPPPRWVFDMGDNMAGFATLTLPRSALVVDQPVTLKYAEVLKGDGSVDMAWCAEGAACKCSGINCANQTDTFLPAPAAHSADTSVTYTPSFTYHGFRYVQVEGLAHSYTPTAEDLTGLFVHSAVRTTGNVNFNHTVLDGVQRAIVQTQKSNLHFHPTDCPQREKRGWTGDAQFTSRQASLNLDMRQLYGNWLQTMQDHDEVGCAAGGSAAPPVFPQANKDICCNPEHASFGCDYTGIPNGTFADPGGSVADVVPFMYVGGWPGDPSWGSISSVLPYTVWKGGDDALVAAYYGGAKRNVDFFIREANPATGLIEFGYYGDWLSLAPVDKPQVTATAQIMATSHLVEMAVHLGNVADARHYNGTLAAMKTAYHGRYWDTAAKSYKGGAQTANLMPLILDIPPPAERALAASAFVAKVVAAGNATSSGLVGASFVLQALVMAGRGDIALSMAMRDEEPSWGYMVKQGPGTIWETWNDESNSHNHPMFTASIGPYLYAIAGLDPSTWSVPGYNRRRSLHGPDPEDVGEEITMHVTPDPHAVRVLGQASATVATLCGQMTVEWRAVRGTRFEMAATVPHNCGRARLVLHVPDSMVGLSDSLCVGNYHLDNAEVSPLPNNVFAAQLTPGNRTVDVVVGGGRLELSLGRC
jgi:hypothetical protein